MYKSFKEMPVWKQSFDLSINVFKLTSTLPKSEDYALTSQLRRSANSISANISEGFGRNSNRNKIQFYIIARGSAFETQNHLLYGKEVGYFDSDIIDNLIKEYNDLILQLNKLIKTINLK